MAKLKKAKEENIVIKAPKLVTAGFRIVGKAPYVQHKFSEKTRKAIEEQQQQGQAGKNKKQRKERDPVAEYEAAKHLDTEGNLGIPAAAFRSAMISACRLCGFQMTKAKLTVFIEPDGIDATDGTPLVHIQGEPEMHTAPVRLASGVTSIAYRPMWKEWSADLYVTYDADQFSSSDIANLLMRAGLQVGIGEGRPDSKKSHGMGWGLFDIQEGGA